MSEHKLAVCKIIFEPSNDNISRWPDPKFSIGVIISMLYLNALWPRKALLLYPCVSSGPSSTVTDTILLCQQCPVAGRVVISMETNN